MKTQRIAALAAAVITAFSASVSVCAENYDMTGAPTAVTAAAKKTAEKKKEIKYSRKLEIKTEMNTAITAELPKASDVTAVSSDKEIMTVKKVSYSKGTAKVTVKGNKAGTAYLKIYDKKNKKNSLIYRIDVLGEDNEYNYENVKLKADDSDYKGQVLELINRERKKAGTDPLTLDEDLCKAADIRAAELSEEYSHTRPDGTVCFTVLDDLDIKYDSAGENIATRCDTAKDVMQAWMNSENHKKNIISKKFTKVGIGYDSDSESWVQIFAS